MIQRIWRWLNSWRRKRDDDTQVVYRLKPTHFDPMAEFIAMEEELSKIEEKLAQPSEHLPAFPPPASLADYVLRVVLWIGLSALLLILSQAFGFEILKLW